MRIFVNEFCGHPFQMELSRNLAKLGHDVLHVYFADNTSTPKGQTQTLPGDPDGLAIEGLHITRPFNKHSLLSRRQADIEYGTVVAERMKLFRPDVVLSANMPIDGQAVLQRAAHQQNARFIFWLQDVYTEAAKFVLRKKAKVLAWAGGMYFERLEKKLLRRSDAIVCIAPGFSEFLRTWGISGPKVQLVENWAPLDEVRPQPKANAWASEHGVADKFCFVYSGTLGMKHRPELLLGLAKHLQSRGDARLVVVAGGAGADWLAEHQNEVKAGVMQLLPFQPYAIVPQVMASADVLITLLDAEAGAFAVPSKTLAYLCAGRALLIAAPEKNEAARVVQRAEAGLTVRPDDQEAFIAAADHLLADTAQCAQYGRNARAYAERTFSIDAITEKFLNIINQTCGQNAAHEMPAQVAAAPALSERSH